MTATLYSYWRSSAAYRVRIALNLKGLDYETVSVSLVDGRHRSDEFRARNPQGFVPFYDDGNVATGQSLAIMEYLEEAHPAPPLLPADTADRAFVRAFANLVCCDIHPLNNLRVLRHLEAEFGAGDDAKRAWYRHWIGEGFDAAETLAVRHANRGVYTLGDLPTIADACLVPQVYNARRFDLDMDRWPRLAAIDAACRELEAFRRAAPEAQPDAL